MRTIYVESDRKKYLKWAWKPEENVCFHVNGGSRFPSDFTGHRNKEKSPLLLSHMYSFALVFMGKACLLSLC